MILDTALYPRINIPLWLRVRFFCDRIMQISAASSIEDTGMSSRSLEREFRELLTRENVTISRICFAYACSVAEFDDLRQDALINIWRGMKSFRGEANQRSWIYRVTVNSCLSTIRSQNRHRHESLEGLYGLIESDEHSREAIEEMHGAMAALSAQEKAIIMMWLDECSYEEIASAMGLNRNTVATKIRRIKEKISKEYKKNLL